MSSVRDLGKGAAIPVGPCSLGAFFSQIRSLGPPTEWTGHPSQYTLWNEMGSSHTISYFGIEDLLATLEGEAQQRTGTKSSNFLSALASRGQSHHRIQTNSRSPRSLEHQIHSTTISVPIDRHLREIRCQKRQR